MKPSLDFHLFTDRSGNHRISVSRGRGKTRAVVCNGAFAQMLVELAERVLKADAAVRETGSGS